MEILKHWEEIMIFCQYPVKWNQRSTMEWFQPFHMKKKWKYKKTVISPNLINRSFVVGGITVFADK